MCHGSCLAALPNGKLLCVWFGGRREGDPDTEIYCALGTPRVAVERQAGSMRGTGSRIHNGRAQEEVMVSCAWSEPVCLTHMPEACWNPVLLVQHDYVLLFFKTGNVIANWQTYRMFSRTDPLYWNDPQPLVPKDSSGGRGPVRTKPIILSSGRICAGGSVERGDWQSFCDYSDDHGLTWTRTALLGLSLIDENLPAEEAAEEKQPPVPAELPPLSPQSFNGRGVIQPSLWQEMNGRLHMYMRSTEGFLYGSISEDEGQHWTEPRSTGIYNNNSGFDVIRVPGGRLFLACNPVKGSWGPRTPLALFMGTEDGSIWEMCLRLEKGKGEYSYPSLTYTFNGLWVSYTYDRKNIAVAFLTWQEIARCRKFRI